MNAFWTSRDTKSYRFDKNGKTLGTEVFQSVFFYYTFILVVFDIDLFAWISKLATFKSTQIKNPLRFRKLFDYQFLNDQYVRNTRISKSLNFHNHHMSTRFLGFLYLVLLFARQFFSTAIWNLITRLAEKNNTLMSISRQEYSV